MGFGAAEDQYAWLYLGSYLFSMMVSWVNAFPMVYKGKVMKQNAGARFISMELAT